MSILKLPPELWLLICENLPGSDAKSCRLANRQLCAMVTSHVFRRLDLSHSIKHDLYLCKIHEIVPRLMSIAPFVRELTLAPLGFYKGMWISWWRGGHTKETDVRLRTLGGSADFQFKNSRWYIGWVEKWRHDAQFEVSPWENWYLYFSDLWELTDKDRWKRSKTHSRQNNPGKTFAETFNSI